MKKSVRRLLFWTPRVLCILFALFISVFALGSLARAMDSGRRSGRC